jgi:hypothetical protein
MMVAEYRSQAQQDWEETQGRCGASCGPAHKPTTAYSAESELQYKLWDMEIYCDVVLEHDRAEGKFTVRAIGPKAAREAAKPIIQEWLNDYCLKCYARA